MGRDRMSEAADRRVAIVTGASQGIGAGIAAAFRHAGYAVVGTSRSIRASDEPGFLTVQGDIADAETAQRVVDQALDRFGRIDSLINNAGIFIGKPFTDYTARRLRGDHGREPGRVLPHHPARHPADGRAGRRPRRQHHDEPRRSRRQRAALRAGIAHQGRPGSRHALARDRVRGARRAGQCGGTRRRPDPDARPGLLRGPRRLQPLGRLGEVGDIAEAILYLERATFVTGEILHVDGGQAAGH